MSFFISFQPLSFKIRMVYISYQNFNQKAIIPSYLHIWQIEHGGNMFLDKDKDYGSDSKTESYSTGPASEMVYGLSHQ